MEKHGVTLVDYACACANLAGGMPLDQICKILGIEESLYSEVEEFWGNASMSDEDDDIFNEAYMNPKQGKFANVENSKGGVEDVLKKYPEWSDYLKMFAYSTEAATVGLTIDFDKEFGISVTDFTQLGAHWAEYYREKMMDEEVSNLQTKLTEKWTAFYKEKFKDNSANISEDIDF